MESTPQSESISSSAFSTVPQINYFIMSAVFGRNRILLKTETKALFDGWADGHGNSNLPLKRSLFHAFHASFFLLLQNY